MPPDQRVPASSEPRLPREEWRVVDGDGTVCRCAAATGTWAEGQCRGLASRFPDESFRVERRDLPNGEWEAVDDCPADTPMGSCVPRCGDPRCEEAASSEPRPLDEQARDDAATATGWAADRLERSSEPRPENPWPEPKGTAYETLLDERQRNAWDEGRESMRAAFDAVVAERDEARAELAAFRQFTADQIERAGSMAERQEDQIEAQIRDSGRDRIELDKRARRLAHLERALKHLREFVQDGEVRRIIDAALDGEDWDA